MKRLGACKVVDLDVHVLKCGGGGGWWAVSDGGSWTITSAQQGMTLRVSVCAVGPEKGRRSKKRDVHRFAPLGCSEVSL